jgi:hypothetical protein
MSSIEKILSFHILFKPFKLKDEIKILLFKFLYPNAPRVYSSDSSGIKVSTVGQDLCYHLSPI